MMLWVSMTILCSAAVVLVTIPLVRRYEHYKDMARAGTSIFTDQLREIERDRDLGLIGKNEADLARVEIERRLLAAAKHVPEPRPISLAWRRMALAAVVGFVVLGSINLYAWRGSPDKIQSGPVPVAVPGPAPVADAATRALEVDAMIARLAKRLEQDPRDAEGWRMLGWSYFNIERYGASADAYAKAMALDPTNMDYKAGYAEALVQDAEGMVTPKAQEIFSEVLKNDPKELRARFYTALGREQAGDLSAALDGWLSLLADAPQNAGWASDVKLRITDLAKKTGRDVSAALAGTAADAAPSSTGLSADDQQAMIQAMVENLAEKLVQSPRDSEGWLRLIRSRMVLNQPELAKEALQKAVEVFSNDPVTSTQIVTSARQLGVVLE